jgi:hypothetical protein
MLLTVSGDTITVDRSAVDADGKALRSWTRFATP